MALGLSLNRLGGGNVRNDYFNSPLTEKEQKFATENHYLIRKYLNIRHLPFDEWYDIVIFRYLRSVKRWFAIPELHKHSFEIVAFYAMKSAIGHELEKQNRRIKAVSLDDVIPGTDGMTFGDTVTYDNLQYIDYEEGENMNIKYNVELPERNVFRGGIKSDEIIAIENFLKGKMKNMCFKYDSADEAKRKLASVQAYRRKFYHKEIYDVYRSENCLYIVRLGANKRRVCSR